MPGDDVWPKIITAVGESDHGFAALIMLVAGVLALALFRKVQVVARLVAFLAVLGAGIYLLIIIVGATRSRDTGATPNLQKWLADGKRAYLEFTDRTLTDDPRVTFVANEPYVLWFVPATRTWHLAGTADGQGGSRHRGEDDPAHRWACTPDCCIEDRCMVLWAGPYYYFDDDGYVGDEGHRVGRITMANQ